MREPTAWQRKVMGIPFNIAGPGGRGGGKTELELYEALRHVVQHGGKVLFIRRSYPALKEIEERLVALFAEAIPAATYNRSEHILRAPNGGTVELGFMEGEFDFARYQGRECSLLIIDEATLWPSMRPLFKLRSNLRSASGVPTRTIIAANPGGPGHVPFASAFVTTRKPWEPYELEPGDWWVTCPSTLADNPHLPSSYETTLRAACSGDRALLAAWLEGSWDAIGGAFFAGQFGPHLILPADDTWTRPPRSTIEMWRPEYRNPEWGSYWSFDFGMSAPGVALGIVYPHEAGAIGPGGLSYPKRSRIVLCEVHSADPSDPSRGLEWPIDVWADELKAAGLRFGISNYGVADDARGLGADETVISELGRNGIQMTKPDKSSRHGGWSKLKSYMTAAKNRDPDVPWTMIHPRCLYTIETVAALPRDPRRMEDADTSAIDHAADAWRYGVTHSPPSNQVFRHLIY